MRLALQHHREHPEITFRRDALLLSINERLGVLCSALSPGITAGADLEPLSTEWVTELQAFAEADLEDIEDGRQEFSL